LERWFEARSGDWSPSTAQQTRWVINGNLKGLSDRKVSAIGVEDLDGFYAALRERGGRGGRPLAGSTVARTHTIVRLALKQAVVWGWRADNPAERANPGRYDSAEIQPPSADDVRLLFDAAFEKDHELLTFVALEAETGARRSELAALRFTDFAEGSVSISRSLVVGIDSDENQRRYAGHYWRATVRRAERPTAVIEEAQAKEPPLRPDDRPVGTGGAARCRPARPGGSAGRGVRHHAAGEQLRVRRRRRRFPPDPPGDVDATVHPASGRGRPRHRPAAGPPRPRGHDAARRRH
jgi:integrase